MAPRPQAHKHNLLQSSEQGWCCLSHAQGTGAVPRPVLVRGTEWDGGRGKLSAIRLPQGQSRAVGHRERLAARWALGVQTRLGFGHLRESLSRQESVCKKDTELQVVRRREMKRRESACESRDAAADPLNAELPLPNPTGVRPFSQSLSP